MRPRTKPKEIFIMAFNKCERKTKSWKRARSLSGELNFHQIMPPKRIFIHEYAEAICTWQERFVSLLGSQRQ